MRDMSQQYAHDSRREFSSTGCWRRSVRCPRLVRRCPVPDSAPDGRAVYPDHLPLDTDNDLILVNDGLTPAVGEVTHLSGRVLDGRGDPIRNALVEIWQVGIIRISSTPEVPAVAGVTRISRDLAGS